MSRLWQRVRFARKKSATPQRCALQVEQLEIREVLSTTVPNVTYHGGPLLQNVQIQAVYSGTAWNSNTTLQSQVAQTDAFLQYLPTSPFFSVLSQYSAGQQTIGQGSFLKHDIVAQDPTNQIISDSQIQTEIQSEITAGNLAAPTANSLYVFFTTPGVVVTAGNENSARDFAGYHDVFTTSSGAPAYYAVIPYPSGPIANVPLTTFQSETYVASHEIAEAVTDPDTQTGWFDAKKGDDGEIADIADGQGGILNGYEVTGLWSQSAKQVLLPPFSTTTTPPTSTLQVKGTSFDATAGQAVTTVVATITSADASATPGSFTASIAWGDGHTSTGTLTTDPNGGFDVTGTNTYAGAGWYNVTVTVSNISGTVVGTALTRASVAPVPPTVDVQGKIVNATAGTAFTGTVATFTDVRTGAAIGDFTTTINWGDGSSSAGTVTADPNGGFDVTGTHTYAVTPTPVVPTFGNFGFGFFGGHGFGGDQFYITTITVTDNPASASATALGLAKVAPTPPSIVAKGQNIQATSGTAFTGTVATFTSTDSTASAATFTATITWGDGTTSTGTVAADPNGGYDVTGTHTYILQRGGGGGGGILPPIAYPTFYPPPQDFIVGVSITDTTTKATANTQSLATVAPAPPVLAVTADNLQAVSGVSFTSTVATFTDANANANAVAGNFKATIQWGDGSSSMGTVTADPKGGFDVTGTHTYTLPSNPVPLWNGSQFNLPGAAFTFSVTVTDMSNDLGKSQATASVAPAPTDITASGTQINAVAGQAFTGNVATFTTQNSKATATTFTATIDWGDGTTSTGTVVADPNGGYDVTGTHTYSGTSTTPIDPNWSDPQESVAIIDKGPGFHGNSFIVRVTITDTSNQDMATAVSLASVSPTPPKLVASGQTLNLTAGQAFTGTVATFTDADSDPVGNFTATINWGDKTTSTGTVTVDAKGGFDVGGSHTYVNPGSYPVFVTITDTDGTKAFSLGSAVVASTSSQSLTNAATALTSSAEYQANVIIKDYQQFLGRTPSSPEIAYWISTYGSNDNGMVAGFLGSSEFYQLSGGSSAGWVQTLYKDLLGRGAGASEVGYWQQRLANTSKPSIVMGFETSPEYEGLMTQNYYQHLLNRSASTAEVAYWVGAMQQQGVSDNQVLSAILGSQAYFQEQQSSAQNWIDSSYQNLLNRAPDQSGFEYFMNVLS